MNFLDGRTAGKPLAVALAAAAILAFSVRETTPGRQPEPLAAPPHLEDVALFEEIQAWLDPAADADQALPADRPLYAGIQSRRESFELFIGAADETAIQATVQGLPFGMEILHAAKLHDVDPLLVAAIVQSESSFDTFAVSPEGALGLMQMMPETAENLGLHNVHDPGQNVDAGVRYLEYLLRRFDGDLVLALAAYNAGPGSVDRFEGMPPFRETRQFTEDVLRLYVKHHRAAWAAVNPHGLDFAVLAGG